MPPTGIAADGIAERRPVSWRERLFGVRNRLLASPRFQRWATVFPLTRPLARRNARALFDLCAGFIYSQVLLSCVRLDLLNLLRDEPASAAAIASRVGLEADAARCLLEAAVALELLQHYGADRYGLGSMGAMLLNNRAVLAMIEHHAMLYRDLADPVAMLRNPHGDTELKRYWAYAKAAAPESLSDEEVARYSTLMSASVDLVSAELLDVYDFAGARCLLDVGGGEGAFVAAVAARKPQLDLMLFDLPSVAARAEARLAAAGLGGRIRTHGGDFFRDSLPTGADVATLVRILHDHDDDDALRLLRAIHAALADGGTLVVAEPMAAAPGAAPAGAAYFGFYLWAMGSGRPRRRDETTALLRAAGFNQVRPVKTRVPLQTEVLVAKKVVNKD